MDIKHIEVKLARATTLPILPNVVTQVLSLTDNMNASSRDYERIIVQDAALATKILRTANSSYFSGGTEITTLKRALAQLGTGTLRSVCLTAAFQSVLSSKTLTKGFNASQFWMHSLAVACASKVLAAVSHDGRAEEAFLAGLFHDIGKLALCMFLPLEAAQVYRMMATSKMSQFDAEMTLMELTHQDIGRLAAEKWGLPAAFLNPIAYHHAPCDMDGDMDTITAYVHVGNAIAHGIGYGFAPPGAETEADPYIQSMLSLEDGQLQAICAAVSHEVSRMGAQMGL